MKCQPASSERKTVAKPRPMYAILSNILIEIMVVGYNVVGWNTLQIEGLLLIIVVLEMFDIHNARGISFCKHVHFKG